MKFKSLFYTALVAYGTSQTYNFDYEYEIEKFSNKINYAAKSSTHASLAELTNTQKQIENTDLENKSLEDKTKLRNLFLRKRDAHIHDLETLKAKLIVYKEVTGVLLDQKIEEISKKIDNNRLSLLIEKNRSFLIKKNE